MEKEINLVMRKKKGGNKKIIFWIEKYRMGFLKDQWQC